MSDCFTTDPCLGDNWGHVNYWLTYTTLVWNMAEQHWRGNGKFWVYGGRKWTSHWDYVRDRKYFVSVQGSSWWRHKNPYLLAEQLLHNFKSLFSVWLLKVSEWPVLGGVVSRSRLHGCYGRWLMEICRAQPGKQKAVLVVRKFSLIQWSKETYLKVQKSV